MRLTAMVEDGKIELPSIAIRTQDRHERQGIVAVLPVNNRARKIFPAVKKEAYPHLGIWMILGHTDASKGSA